LASHNLNCNAECLSDEDQIEGGTCANYGDAGNSHGTKSGESSGLLPLVIIPVHGNRFCNDPPSHCRSNYHVGSGCAVLKTVLSACKISKIVDRVDRSIRGKQSLFYKAEYVESRERTCRSSFFDRHGWPNRGV